MRNVLYAFAIAAANDQLDAEEPATPQQPGTAPPPQPRMPQG